MAMAAATKLCQRALASAKSTSALRGATRSYGAGPSGNGVTYEGVTIQPPSLAHRVAAEIMGGMLWSWVLIRAYEDGRGLIYGHAEHFDHELEALQGDEE